MRMRRTLLPQMASVNGKSGGRKKRRQRMSARERSGWFVDGVSYTDGKTATPYHHARAPRRGGGHGGLEPLLAAEFERALIRDRRGRAREEYATAPGGPVRPIRLQPRRWLRGRDRCRTTVAGSNLSLDRPGEFLRARGLTSRLQSLETSPRVPYQFRNRPSSWRNSGQAGSASKSR
jgi:hypothetical protein